MRTLSVLPIPAEATHGLRQQILRPHQSLAEVVFAGDTAPGSAHWGLFAAEGLVGIASLIYEPASIAGLGSIPWRLRGMAVLASERRRGGGRALVNACWEYVRQQSGAGLWCNARALAVPFYAALGFAKRGEAFVIEGIGAHYVMTCTAAPVEAAE